MQVATVPFSFTVNGVTHDMDVDPRTTVLDLLREHLGLTGAKKGCDRGQCGACTVLVDGRRANSCLLLAVSVAGRHVTTIEGLTGLDGTAHPMQQAFVDHDALQCGYCTPGQICSAVGVAAEVAAGWASAATNSGATPELSDAEVRERMSGNLCRCGAYANIVPAVVTGAST